MPNTGGAATFDNINQLLKEIALRLGLAPRRNLKYIPATGTPRPYEIDKRSASTGALPGCDRNRGQIFYAMTTHNRNFLRLLPQIVGRLIRVGCCFCQIHASMNPARILPKRITPKLTAGIWRPQSCKHQELRRVNRCSSRRNIPAYSPVSPPRRPPRDAATPFFGMPHVP